MFLYKIFKNLKNKKRFNDISYEWLEIKRNEVKESTYYNYLFIIEKYLNNEFWGLKIDNISDFNYFIKRLNKTLSCKTIRDIVSVLKMILNYYESEYNVKLNYKKISVPKSEKNYIKVLSNKEKLKLEKYCLDRKDLKLFGIVLCLNTGLRVGEICALKWEDIDLEEKNLYVKKTLQRVYDSVQKKTKINIDRPKTENSIRCIPISKKIYEILKPLKKEYKPNQFFLTGSSTKFIEPRNYQNTFKKVLKASKVKQNNFHILRHTFASNCIEVGMDIKSLSEILGHSSVEITLNRYVHSSRKSKKKYLEKL